MVSKRQKPKYSIRTEIKLVLLKRLYVKHMNYWNVKLLRLAYKNALHAGRSSGDRYRIFWREKAWNPLSIQPVPDLKHYHYMELAPKFEKEMSAIAEEIEEIEEEKHDVNAFLTGILLFRPPHEAYRQILGDTLYESCSNLFRRLTTAYPHATWSSNDEASLFGYVHEHSYIIKMMHERLIFNLITQDGYNAN